MKDELDLEAKESTALSARDISVEMGIPIEEIITAYAAMGILIPDQDEAKFSERDMEMFRTLRQLAKALDMDQNDIGELIRVFGMSLARLADAFVGVYMRGHVQRMAAQNLSELEQAEISLELRERGKDIPALDVIGVQLGHHITNSFKQYAESLISIENPGQLQMVVGFLDVSGYSALVTGIDSEELMDLITLYENLALRIITKHGGRMVKVIGDEVLFVVNDPDKACHIAIELSVAFCENASNEYSEGTALHGGMAYGEVVFHRGDYYGQVVNLASRLSDISIKGEFLVTSDLVSALQDDNPFKLSPAGKREVRGFEDSVDVYSLEWSNSRQDG